MCSEWIVIAFIVPQNRHDTLSLSLCFPCVHSSPATFNFFIIYTTVMQWCVCRSWRVYVGMTLDGIWKLSSRDRSFYKYVTISSYLPFHSKYIYFAVCSDQHTCAHIHTKGEPHRPLGKPLVLGNPTSWNHNFQEKALDYRSRLQQRIKCSYIIVWNASPGSRVLYLGRAQIAHVQ